LLPAQGLRKNKRICERRNLVLFAIGAPLRIGGYHRIDALAEAVMAGKTRIEHDSMGELRVPADALYGAQTQRAVDNFPVSGLRMPREFIRALGLIKAACATANAELGHLKKGEAKAILASAMRVASGELDGEFPIDVFQTGSGTSSNMNANEVIATLASRAAKTAIHPNDHVNLGQSSNDVIPTAIQVSASLSWHEHLRPSLLHLRRTIDRRAKELARVVKTGRTHLMDAMPLSLGQELSAYSAQISNCIERLDDSARRLHRLPLGGTAIGTGINADPQMSALACAELSRSTEVNFAPAKNKFEGIAGQDGAVELSGQLNVLAVVLMKLANDLRWMNSGPLAGLGEIELPALQPGSSIMPGKVNPVIPEAVAMVCAQVIGNHGTITVAGASGNFQLNVMLPVIAHNLLESLRLLANVTRLLADKAIAGFRVCDARIAGALTRNPILVTALNPIIGYEKAAEIAKRAYKEGRPVLDVAKELSGLSEKELKKLLDPALLIRGGLHGGGGSGG
jgi:fumarate hydratase class II